MRKQQAIETIKANISKEQETYKKLLEALPDDD
jgi:hypothetical protein